MKVYLSGGMRSGWQDAIVKEVDGVVIFLDPRSHGQNEEKNYTAWDLTAISRADIVFAYLEADNPIGIGMALEIGFAKALQIPVIFVEAQDNPKSKYFGICRASADFYYKSLDDGINALIALVRVFND